MTHYLYKTSKRVLITLALFLTGLNVSADDDNDPAVLVFYCDTLIDCYKYNEVEDISHIASDNNLTEPDILQITINGTTYEYPMNYVDSVVFTPPTEFFSIQTRPSITNTYLTATLRSTLGGKWSKWNEIERGFVFSEERQPLRDKKAKRIYCGRFPKPGTIEQIVTHAEYGLKGDKLYYYNAWARYGKFIIYGLTESFKLKPVTIWTDDFANVEDDETNEGFYKATVTADIYGDTDELAYDPHAKIGFYYDYTTNPNIVIDPDRDSETAKREEGELNETKDIEAVLRKLEPGKKYYYRPFVEIADTIYYGKTASFYSGYDVNVITYDAYNVGAASATVYYALEINMADGQLKGGVAGIQYTKMNDGTPDLDNLGEDTYHTLAEWSPESDGFYTANFTKIEPNSTYYYRAFAVIDSKLYYGNVKSFTTKDITITTYDAKDVTSFTARIDGELKDKDAINEGDKFGFYLNITGDPGPDNSYNSYGIFESGSDGTFWWNITGMIPSTTYYYRAYVTYREKTYLGEIKEFKTKEGFLGELGLFELKGRVASCKWTNLYGSNTRTFDRNGMWQTSDGTSINSIYNNGIQRDNLGRILVGSYDEGGNESWEYNSIGAKTQYTDEFWDGGETHTYVYDNNSMVTTERVEMLGMDVEWNENYTLTYSNHVLDNHGNWIQRTRRDSTDGSTSTETRVITYYDE